MSRKRPNVEAAAARGDVVMRKPRRSTLRQWWLRNTRPRSPKLEMKPRPARAALAMLRANAALFSLGVCSAVITTGSSLQ